MKPYSIFFGIKSVYRRKQKNFFGILAIALGVSLITGITITDQSLSDGFGVFFTYSLGEVDGRVVYTGNFMNESTANIIGNDLTSLQNVTAYTSELTIPVTTSTIEGQINVQSTLRGINKSDNTDYFGSLINEQNTKLNISSLSPNEVYVGKALADDLQISTGNKFNFSLSLGPFQIEHEFTVKDIVKDVSRGAMGSNDGIFLDLGALQGLIEPALQQLFPVSQPVTVIYLRFSSNVQTVADAKFLQQKMEDKLSGTTLVSHLGGIKTLIISTDRITIKDSGKALADGLGQILTIFGSVLIIAGLILIVNIQLMTIENKEKQIGIQRAVGTKSLQVIFSNLTEFVVVGIIGGLVGIFGGIMFGWILIIAFGVSFGFDGTLISVQVPPSVLTTAFLMGFLISILSGLYPSIKASKVNVIEVLRGMSIKEFKVKQGSGIWGFGFGLLLTVLGLLSNMGLSKNPFDYPSSYANLSDAESIYLATTFFLVGALVLLSYFISRNKILSIAGISLILYPLFQIFFVFNEIKKGSGGVDYILVMTISLIGGSILLVSLNLDKIAGFSEKIFSVFFSAISMISFKQMSSQKTRSTLTFAIFAFILTLNIFLASWSYSDRYGAENQVNILSGNSDVLVISQQPLPSNVSQQYVNGLETKFSSVTHASAFPHSGPSDVYLNDNGSISNTSISKFKMDLFAVNNNSFVQDNKVVFNFLMQPGKLNTTKYSFPDGFSQGLEFDNKTSSLDSYSDSNVKEDTNAWQFLSDGLMVTNKTSGKKLPVIVTSYIATVDLGANSIHVLKHVMDSVWLPLRNGTFQEFVIMGISSSNPIFDSYILGIQTGTAGLSTGAFINAKYAKDLAAFNPSPQYSKLNESNYFLLSTPYNGNSQQDKVLASNIETWSNGLNATSFRIQEGKLYGMIATTTYFIYETQFDGNFRFFQFMQYFTTLGFLFGVVSLLVVSVRSVQERKREIGMMRSIGVKRHEVVISLILELSVMGIIGLLIGLLIGNVLAYGLVHINSGGLTKFLIPWENILIYTVITLGSALFASIIPGRVASNIPPSDALRYTG